MAPTTRTKTAVVTGASSGIGRAVARRLIDSGWRVFGSVRRERDAAEVAEALGEGFTPVLFDVTDETSIRAAAAQINSELGGRTLTALVNNAGVAVAGPLRYIPIDEVKRQFDVNVHGVLRVSQAFIPALGASPDVKGRPGKIVNVSSVAGKIATPLFGPYAMSKHALEALSDVMRRELMMHGIDVMIVGPGAVKTPIWEKGEQSDFSAYEGTEYRAAIEGVRTSLRTLGDEGIDAARVGDLVYDMLMRQGGRPRRAILADRFTDWIVPKWLPTRILDRILADRFSTARKPGADGA